MRNNEDEYSILLAIIPNLLIVMSLIYWLLAISMISEVYDAFDSNYFFFVLKDTIVSLGLFLTGFYLKHLDKSYLLTRYYLSDKYKKK